MSKTFKNSSYWLNNNGIVIKITLPWYIPFKKRKLKQAMFLMEVIDLIHTYDAKTGNTGTVVQRVWSKKNGVEL